MKNIHSYKKFNEALDFKFCSECGTRNSRGAQFCIECGKSFSEEKKDEFTVEGRLKLKDIPSKTPQFSLSSPIKFIHGISVIPDVSLKEKNPIDGGLSKFVGRDVIIKGYCKGGKPAFNNPIYVVDINIK